MPPRAVIRTRSDTPNRINWLRWLALLFGGLVFLGHIITLKEWEFYPYWLSVDWPDVYKHFTMLAYPNRSHGIFEGPGTRRHLYTYMTRYLNEHMPPGGVEREPATD